MKQFLHERSTGVGFRIACQFRKQDVIATIHDIEEMGAAATDGGTVGPIQPQDVVAHLDRKILIYGVLP